MMRVKLNRHQNIDSKLFIFYVGSVRIENEIKNFAKNVFLKIVRLKPKLSERFKKMLIVPRTQIFNLRISSVWSNVNCQNVFKAFNVTVIII